MSQKQHVFDYFSVTTGEIHSQFSTFATLYSILTENRQAKPNESQIKSLRIFVSYTFYTLRTELKIRTSADNFFVFFLFSCVPNGFKSCVKRCNNFIWGNGAFSLNTLYVISLRSLRSFTQVYEYEKNQRLQFNLHWGRVENVLAVVFHTTKLRKKVFGLF